MYDDLTFASIGMVGNDEDRVGVSVAAFETDGQATLLVGGYGMTYPSSSLPGAWVRFDALE